MKRILPMILLISLLISNTAIAAPMNNEEIQKKIQAEMKNNPEFAKMIKQQGLDKQYANTAANAQNIQGNYNTGGIPEKDNNKINKIPKKIMNDEELRAYLKEVHQKVEHAISKEARNNAEKIITATKKKYNNNSTALANVASACWMIRHQEEALYIMGVACNEDPNPDNLNNYAAFMTMSKGGHLAIPILNKLNQQYPNNSTILNNLGQAWFSMGDLNEAEKYLNAAILAFPDHSQANYTKSVIEESKGNTPEAIAAMKRSIKGGYSSSKASKLKKLGGKLNKDDINLPMPQDPLGLDNFTIPPYPKNSAEIVALTPLWKDFKDKSEAKLNALNRQAESLNNTVLQKAMTTAKKFENMKSTADLYKIKLDKPEPESPLKMKAEAKLKLVFADEERRKDKEFEAKLEQTASDIEALKDRWEKEAEPIEKAYNEQIGEGLPNKDEPYCSQLTGIADKYIGLINARYEDVTMEYLSYLRRKYNTNAYYEQYTTTGGDEAVELMKTRYKMAFMAYLNQAPVFLEYNSCKDYSNKGKTSYKLADFYDLHCDQHVTLGIPDILYAEWSCNKEKITVDIPGLSAKWKENMDTGKFKGSAEIGVSIGKSVDIAKYGPLKAELGAEAKVAGFVEFDNSGVTDFGGKISAEINAGAGASIDVTGKDILNDGGDINYGTVGKSGSSSIVGVESRFGWNSGISSKGTGILEGVL